MLVRTPTLRNENWTLTYVPVQAGEGLQLCPVGGQHQEGHSKRGKYNSAYSIGSNWYLPKYVRCMLGVYANCMLCVNM